jgi:hypothetical protein
MRFVQGFVLTLGLLLASAAALNYVVNPYALYPLQLFVPASANALESSLREIEKPQFQPQLVVLGSSRSARLRPADLDCFSGMTSANTAYAGGTPQGYYALTAYLLEHKPKPKLLIVGLDVEAFKADAKFADRIANVPRLRRYVDSASLAQALWMDATNLVSLAQVTDSLRVVAQALWEPNAGAAELARKVESSENRREATPAETIAHNLGRYAGYTTLSPEEEAYLEALLRLAQEQGIQVKLFITTMHPQLVEALNRQGLYPARLSEVRALLRGLQARYAFTVHDFSTPDKFGGNNSDFFNLSHIDEVNSARLIGALFAEQDRAALCAGALPQKGN